MDLKIVALILTLDAGGMVNGDNFTYTINNNVLDPHFRHSLNLPIQRNSYLIDRMENACMIASGNFTRFTATFVSNVRGYFISSINNVGDVGNGTLYWRLTKNGTTLRNGVNGYVPSTNDDVLFNLTARRYENPLNYN